MKTSFLIIISAIFLLLESCKKCDHPRYQSAGQIGGPDYGMCACCGGYFITIDSVKYRFYDLPAGSGIDLETDQRPIRVLLNWHNEGPPCGAQTIKIDAILKQ